MSSPLRPAACVGLLTTALGCAALGLGRFVVVPMLTRAHELVDANLATALAQPIHLRLSEIVLVAVLLLFLIVPRWTRSPLAAGTTLVLIGLAGVWRGFLLPAVYAAWSRVDLVAGRPFDRLREAQTLDAYEQVASLAIALLLLVVAWLGLTTSGATASASRPGVASSTIADEEVPQASASAAA